MAATHGKHGKTNRTPEAGGSYLLEHLHNTVTNPGNEHGAYFEVAKCNCRCWFCPDCCMIEGYKLRGRLIPVLETFDGLIMASLTIDPQLFSDPQTAYLYTAEKRCIGITTQDLDRWGHLNTRRYFYVVEWQKNTEQAHYHILYDSNFIPWDSLLRSWSKHRPKDAGPVEGKRPAFGTVIFSAPKFASPVHAARYATKYLIKVPEYGFPRRVLEMGKDRRIRRYSTSRGFWGTKSARQDRETTTTRKNRQRTYAQRIAKCGDSVNVFEIAETLDIETGEIQHKNVWIGQLDADASTVMENLYDPGNPERKRRSLLARNQNEALQIIRAASSPSVDWIRHR
ncbi:MAG: hypothetical protein KAR47_11470 [Planctomycetes bacterium]|nr:hypothetical protein [Planctomycetota bacterium]